MGYEEDKRVSKVRTVDAKEAKKQEKALKKLDLQNNDVRSMSVLAIVWHLIVRGRKLWFYCGLVLAGYVLGFFRIGM